MRTKKGRFVTKKAHVKGLLSSSRLKTWHESNISSDKNDASCRVCKPKVGAIVTDGDVPDVGTDEIYVPEDIFKGRRIVELGHLSNQLKMCTNCKHELTLSNTVRENRYGFGSVLTVMCRFCGTLNNIETSKRHRLDGSKRGPKTFVVNTKAVVGK